MPESTETELTQLPIAVIGSGPVGLAAAAHLMERGLNPIIFEAGNTPAAAVTAWGHIRLFSPWQYNIDAAARRRLAGTGWQEPEAGSLPTGAEFLAHYLRPLAALPAISSVLHTNSEVVAVSRDGLDKTHTRGRVTTPFLIRVKDGTGTVKIGRAHV